MSKRKWLPYAIAATGASLSLSAYRDDEGNVKVVSRSPIVTIANTVGKAKPPKSHFILRQAPNSIPPPMTTDNPLPSDDGEGMMGQTTLPKKFVVKQVAVLNPKNGGNMQCVFPGYNKGEWFLTITSPGVHEQQSTIIERHVNGVYQDECHISRCGHPLSSGARGPNNEIWHRFQDDTVRFAYRPGTIPRSKMSRVELWTRGGAQVSFSPSGNYVGVWDRSGKTFTRRSVADILAKKNRILGKSIHVPLNFGVLQGYGIVREALFLQYGAPEKPAYVREFSFRTGKVVGPKYDFTALGRNIVGGNHEAESAPGRYLLNKLGQGEVRRLVIGMHNL